MPPTEEPNERPSGEPIPEPPLHDSLPSDALISEVEPIHWPHMTWLEPEQIPRYVEQPLEAACQVFVDKNIRTVGSSANRNDLRFGYAMFVIDFENLTEQNQAIARKYCSVKDASTIDGDERKAAFLTVQIDQDSTIEDVSLAAAGIAEQFEPQERRNPHPLTAEEASEYFGQFTGTFQNYSREDLIKRGFFDYDESTGLFYERD